MSDVKIHKSIISSQRDKIKMGYDELKENIVSFTIVQQIFLCYLDHIEVLIVLVVYCDFTHGMFLRKMPCPKWRNKIMR